MGKGIKHKTVGIELSQAEFEADDSHQLDEGTSFPESPNEGDLFYRTDEHRWYIYNGSDWKNMVPDVGAVYCLSWDLHEPEGGTRTSLSFGKVGEIERYFKVESLVASPSGAKVHVIWRNKSGDYYQESYCKVKTPDETEYDTYTKQHYTWGYDVLTIPAEKVVNGDWEVEIYARATYSGHKATSDIYAAMLIIEG